MAYTVRLPRRRRAARGGLRKISHHPSKLSVAGSYIDPSSTLRETADQEIEQEDLPESDNGVAVHSEEVAGLGEAERRCHERARKVARGESAQDEEVPAQQMARLTTGAVLNMHVATSGTAVSFVTNERTNVGPTLQILDIKRIGPQQRSQPMAGSAPKNFLLLISDGVYYMQAMLTPQLNEMVSEGKVETLCVVQVTGYLVNTLQNERRP